MSAGSSYPNRPPAQAPNVFANFGRLLPILLVVGCASIPERVGKSLSNEVYRAPQAGTLPDSSLAILQLGDTDWIRIDTLLIDHTEYGSVKLLPGVYCLEMGKLFSVSFLVDPRMWAEHAVTGKVPVEAGRTYSLAADRSHGPGYMVWFQLMDAVADTVIPIVERPGDFHVTGSIAPTVPVTGVLDARDSTRFDCSPYEAYDLDVSADMSVEITLESEEFDPFLLLVSPSGEFVPSEDAGEGRKRVHIKRRLEEKGRWLVIVNTLTSRQTGTYHLVVRRR